MQSSLACVPNIPAAQPAHVSVPVSVAVSQCRHVERGKLRLISLIDMYFFTGHLEPFCDKPKKRRRKKKKKIEKGREVSVSQVSVSQWWWNNIIFLFSIWRFVISNKKNHFSYRTFARQRRRCARQRTFCTKTRRSVSSRRRTNQRCKVCTRASPLERCSYLRRIRHRKTLPSYRWEDWPVRQHTFYKFLTSPRRRTCQERIGCTH